VDRKERDSYLVWGAWGAVFLCLELAALRQRSRWYTLSTTSYQLQDHTLVAKLVLDAGLTLLTKHIVDRWP
jgi:hypothetical protein